jgi:hypothetical protein
MDAIFNVTVDSLATYAGVIDNGRSSYELEGLQDAARSRMLKAQVRKMRYMCF